MTPRRHQFSFHSGRNDNNLVRIPLISNRPCCSPLLCFGVWNALSLKTKVSSLCCLVVLIFYPWLNRGLPQTIVLPLSTSRIHLRITLFITCQDPLAEEVDLLLSHAKSFMFPEIRLYFFFVRTFWFSYHLWFKVFRLVTVCRPPPFKKNGFTVERFFSEFSALSEELTVTFCQFLLCGDFNFPVDVD